MTRKLIMLDVCAASAALFVISQAAFAGIPTAAELATLPANDDLIRKICSKVEEGAGRANDDHPLAVEVRELIGGMDVSNHVSIIRQQRKIIDRLTREVRELGTTAGHTELEQQKGILLDKLKSWRDNPVYARGFKGRWMWAGYQMSEGEVNYDKLVRTDPLFASGRVTPLTLTNVVTIIRVVNLANEATRPPLQDIIKKTFGALKEADKQFDRYSKNARVRFLWEQWINDCLYKHVFGARDDTFNLPPGFQVNLGHPYVGYELSDLSGEGALGVFLVDILGFQVLSWDGIEATKWPVGISAVWTYTVENGSDRSGYGAMLHVRGISAGVHVRDSDEKHNDVNYLVGVDALKLLSRGNRVLEFFQ
jgi:hypothetical protein